MRDSQRSRSRRPRTPRVQRLFVAAYPPVERVTPMFERLETLDLPEHTRFTPIEQVHLTLQFIGDTNQRDVPAVIESVERSCSGIKAFALTPCRLMTLPQRRRNPPRLIAMETDAPSSLLELQRRLAARLARRPRAKPDDRFLPHLTLCRFKAGHTTDHLEHAVESESPFMVDEVRLVQSRLRPAGAIHEVVASFHLEPE